MKLKIRPGDFRVFERFAFEEDPRGAFHVHRLRKRKLDTLAALDRIVQAAGVAREDIAYAGLKDRQGATEQYVSIRGQRVELRDPDLQVSFVGRSAAPVSSRMSQGNRFEIVVRDLGGPDLVRLRRNKTAVQNQGLPNYFDDQRFGALTHGQGLTLKPLFDGRPDLALKKILATPDRSGRVGGDRKLREILHRHWGDWRTCQSIARGPMYQAVFGHLVRRPQDFSGALAALPTRLKLIHLYTFQSAIWNRAVSRYLAWSLRRFAELPSVLGRLAAWRYLDAEQWERFRDLELELIAPGTRARDPLFGRATQKILQELALHQEQLAVTLPGFRLKEEARPLVLLPEDLEVGEPEPDEEHRGRFRVRLDFALPRGAYATLVVKRLFAETEQRRFDRDGGDGRRPERRDDRRARPERRDQRAMARHGRDRRDDRGREPRRRDDRGRELHRRDDRRDARQQEPRRRDDRHHEARRRDARREERPVEDRGPAPRAGGHGYFAEEPREPLPGAIRRKPVKPVEAAPEAREAAAQAGGQAPKVEPRAEGQGSAGEGRKKRPRSHVLRRLLG